MSGNEPASRRPLNTAFRQQRLRAWQPILTPRSVIATFFVVGIVFIPIGAVVLSLSNDVVEVEERYDNKRKDDPDSGLLPDSESCAPPDYQQTSGSAAVPTCTFKVNIPKKMKKDVYFYYQLENYYQNHRRYVKSRTDPQLRGDWDLGVGSLGECDPKDEIDVDGERGVPRRPCGLISWSLFNDTFSVEGPGGANVTWDKNGIAWKSDRDEKFKNPSDDASKVNEGINEPNLDFLMNDPWAQHDCEGLPLDQCRNTLGDDEDFIVWMRTAALPKFRKLHRIIRHDLEAGDYLVSVRVRYPVAEFDGKKSVVFSTTSPMGGKNSFLGVSYIVVGCICLALGAAFLIKHRASPRKLGDSRYLDWNESAR